MKIILCPFCYKTFTGRNNQKYCSLECKNKYHAKIRVKSTTYKVCPVCYKHFTGAKNKIYCSTECKNKKHNVYTRDKYRNYHILIKENNELKEELKLVKQKLEQTIQERDTLKTKTFILPDLKGVSIK